MNKNSVVFALSTPILAFITLAGIMGPVSPDHSWV